MPRSILLLSILLVVAACGPADDPEAEILAVMQAAEDGWNAGDLEAYMDCYRRSDSLRFAGGDRVRKGWDAVLETYRQTYPDRDAMGRLEFSKLDVKVLAPDAALVFGRWRLTRDGEAADVAPHGLFTLLLRRFPEGWRIVHDHTSTARRDPT